MLKKSALFLSSFIFLFVSCVTVNIYFPAEAVKRAADEIVEDVYDSNKDDSSKFMESPFNIFCDVAWAQDVDINISSPAIRSIRTSIEGRFSKLKPFYDGGNIGITNRGYIEIRNMGGLDIKATSDLKGLVDAENFDRRKLYNEIAVANNFSSEAVPQIEREFAVSWREQASPGWWIQKDDGSWVRK